MYSDFKIGDIFNRWTVIEIVGETNKGFFYKCICKCGSIGNVKGRSLVKNSSKSCGCFKSIPIEIKLENRRKYKADYFQTNKEKIKTRIIKPSLSVSRGYNYKSNYGITLNDYNDLLKKQNFRCSICNIEHKDQPPKQRLYIDHDHKTDKVRGLICQKCNSGLGLFKDDIELLKRAIIYLEVL